MHSIASNFERFPVDYYRKHYWNSLNQWIHLHHCIFDNNFFYATSYALYFYFCMQFKVLHFIFCEYGFDEKLNIMFLLLFAAVILSRNAGFLKHILRLSMVSLRICLQNKIHFDEYLSRLTCQTHTFPIFTTISIQKKIYFFIFIHLPQSK